jgi:ribosome-associated protein
MAAKKKTTVPSKKFSRKPAKGTKASAKKPAAKTSAPRSPAKKKAPARAKAKVQKTSSARKTLPKKKPSLKAKRPPPRAKRPAPKKKKALLPAAKSTPNPEGLKIARAIAAVALEKKANDVIIIDTSGEAQLVGYDYIVLASGDSDRQLEAISSAVDDALRPTGVKPAGTEISADWVLVDYSDVIAHFFTPDARGQYDFEGRWSHAPRMALA